MAMSEGRSFNIAMFFMTAFLCLMIVVSLNSVLADTEPAVAVAFEAAIVRAPLPAGCEGTVGPVLGNDFWGDPLVTGTRTKEDCEVYQTIPATVQTRGYIYSGTCAGPNRQVDDGTDAVCSAGATADAECGDLLRDEFPSVSSRRLTDESPDARMLRSGHGDGPNCVDAFVPWTVVEFPNPEEPATMLRRCSYRMGTRGNSETKDWEDVVGLPAVGQVLQIWNVHGTGHPHCVVGSAVRQSFLAFAATARKPDSGLYPLVGLFVFISVCMCGMGLKTLILGTDEEPDGGDKDSKGDDDEGSE